jgi:hypothetical protein
VTPLLPVFQVPGSNLDPGNRYASLALRGFLDSFRQILGISKFGHGHFHIFSILLITLLLDAVLLTTDRTVKQNLTF